MQRKIQSLELIEADNLPHYLIEVQKYKDTKIDFTKCGTVELENVNITSGFKSVERNPEIGIRLIGCRGKKAFYL